MVENKWRYNDNPYIRPHGVSWNNFTYGKQDSMNIINTLCCELLGWCFDTFIYHAPSEYVRIGTDKDICMV